MKNIFLFCFTFPHVLCMNFTTTSGDNNVENNHNDRNELDSKRNMPHNIFESDFNIIHNDPREKEPFITQTNIISLCRNETKQNTNFENVNFQKSPTRLQKEKTPTTVNRNTIELYDLHKAIEKLNLCLAEDWRKYIIESKKISKEYKELVASFYRFFHSVFTEYLSTRTHFLQQYKELFKSKPLNKLQQYTQTIFRLYKVWFDASDKNITIESCDRAKNKIGSLLKYSFFIKLVRRLDVAMNIGQEKASKRGIVLEDFDTLNVTFQTIGNIEIIYEELFYNGNNKVDVKEYDKVFMKMLTADPYSIIKLYLSEYN